MGSRLEGPHGKFLNDSAPGHRSIIWALVCKPVPDLVHSLTCVYSHRYAHTYRTAHKSFIFVQVPIAAHRCNAHLQFHAQAEAQLCTHIHSFTCTPLHPCTNMHTYNLTVMDTPVFCTHGHPRVCTHTLTRSYLSLIHI